MSKNYEHIEEKLIPYLEGVLNPKERREVDEAINSDGELSREVGELREVILELRQGFASGLKPPQEELSVEEVVELGANTGSVESLPGSSAQKAKLFCSDDALEEYSLLRALHEEMARTTLDRENIPEMPEAVRREFKALKGTAAIPTRKVIALHKKKLSPVPLWHRASSWLDRVDPKPLMASAAALMVLSLGVHFYNRSPAQVASSDQAAEIGYNFDSEGSPAAPAPAAATTPPLAAQESGVAVFTSDDRALLKEQAQKLMVAKVNYTVTKDRILVAEKDIAQARDILWADQEKAVALAKEESPEKRLVPSSGAASEASSYAAVSDQSYTPGGASAPEVIDEGDIQAAHARGDEDVRVYYSSPSRQDVPAAPGAPRRESSGMGGAARPVERSASSGQASPRRGATAPALPGGDRNASNLGGSPPRPSAVDLSAVRGAPAAESSSLPPQPTVALEPPASVAAPVSAARRQKIKELALGDGTDSASAEPTDYVSEAPEPTQVQTTQTVERARVSAAPPSSSASAPIPSVVLSNAASSAESEESKAEQRLARMETSRQAVAQRHGVELSFETNDDKVTIYVRPKKSLTKVELDELRKALRKELKLADSDTITFR